MGEVMQVMAFDCDLSTAVETQALPNILVKGDKNAHEVRVTVKRDGQPVTIDGATVTGTGVLGTSVVVASGTAAGSVASFVLNEGFYAKSGTITLFLSIALDGVETTVLRGVGQVLSSGAGGTVTDPETVLGWGALQKVAKEAADYISSEPGRKAAEEAREKNEQARIAAETAREKASAAAIGELHDVVTDVQHKLDTGAFVGAQGEKGERGEQGIQGVPGKDGAPGIPGKDGAPGKDAPQIDDSTMTATNPWSSLHTVDMLCPPLDATGNPVVCYPVAGYPLGVKASWTPKQEGAGEPSPENIRPIVGRDTVLVTRQEDSAQVDVQIPHTIYGGEVDAVTGQGAEMWGHATISRVQSATVMDTVVRGVASLTARAVTAKTGSAISSYLPEKVHFVDDAPGFYTNQNSAYIKIAKSLLPSPDMDGLNAYLTAQPLDVAYKLATPVPFTATGGAPLPALAGTNTVLTDADSVQVTGRRNRTQQKTMGLIANISITEAVQVVRIRTGDNGSPFSLEEVLVEIASPKPAETLTRTFYIGINRGEGIAYNAVASCKWLRRGNEKALERIHLKLVGGIVLAQYNGVVNASPYNIMAGGYDQWVCNLGGANMVRYDSIEDLNYRCDEGNYILPGTTIKVWGVTA